MKFEAFEKLSPIEQAAFADHAYREAEVFAGVRDRFLEQYGNSQKISQVLVDNYGIGDAPLLILTLRPGDGRLRLPERFMGFLVYRRYESSGERPYAHPQDRIEQSTGE